MTEIIIHSVIEYLEIINEYTNDSDKIYFRGESKLYEERIPGIYRTISENTKLKYPKLVLEGTKEYFYDLFSEFGWSLHGNKLFEQIVNAQHFGAVTSILDITSNPLAALYFAASGNFNEDGNIFIYETKENSVKRYFGHTISLMTALNFVSRKEINNFIRLFNALLHEIPIDSKLGKSIFKQKITLNKLLDTLENSFNIPETTYVFDLKRIDYLKNPFKAYDFDLLYKDEGNDSNNISNCIQSEVEAKRRILQFIKKVDPNLDDRFYNLEQIESSNLKIKEYQEYLLQKINEIITSFLDSLNQVSVNTDKFIYPYAIYEDMQKSFIVYPTRLNERIKNQKGAFIIPGYFLIEELNINKIQTNIKATMNKCIEEKARIIIDSKSKKQILNQLHQLGIDEGFIYPDIEHIAKTISDKYEN
jgi:hypothetical protein